MEVSKLENQPGGAELLEQVVMMTGLPKELIMTEMNQILARSGVSPQKMTVDDLRNAMVHYLESLQGNFLTDEITQTLPS